MRDERYFPEPEEFKPERFAERPENAASEEIFNPFNSVFGFGRRYAFYSTSTTSVFNSCSELIEFAPVDFLLIQRSGS